MSEMMGDMPVEAESSKTFANDDQTRGPGEAGTPVAVAVADAARRLADAGVPSARADAQLLAAHVLGVGRTGLIIAPPMTGDQVRAYAGLVEGRLARIPLQHLTGRAPFRHLDLAVGPGVFVPRPETELLVEWGLGGLRAGATVVDLCSGSGAIALSVATECPGARVWAVERDPEALRWLERNVRQVGCALTVVPGDVTDPAVLADLEGMVDLVLCNPPYVPLGTPVDPEVADHDPPEAVFAGADGLDTIRALIGRVAALLRPGGRFAVEHDVANGDATMGLLRADGRFREVLGHADLAGRPRFVTAVRDLRA